MGTYDEEEYHNYDEPLTYEMEDFSEEDNTISFKEAEVALTETSTEKAVLVKYGDEDLMVWMPRSWFEDEEIHDWAYPLLLDNIRNAQKAGFHPFKGYSNEAVL